MFYTEGSYKNIFWYINNFILLISKTIFFVDLYEWNKKNLHLQWQNQIIYFLKTEKQTIYFHKTEKQTIYFEKTEKQTIFLKKTGTGVSDIEWSAP